MARRKSTIKNDPHWFKDSIFYELRVRSFADSDGDGIGDFLGATEQLDYLRDLGVTMLWLLPFFPSPLRDDGYDIAGYMDVHPEVGTLEDFGLFLREAHKRDLQVMVELVLNHTSDQHPWFQRARRAPAGSPERDFYVWSDTPDRFHEARIIFKDFETSNWSWDPVAKAYYWHRFFSHQPDLNYDNPLVEQAMFEVVDFWLDKGVDGLRLDAVPYLYEREGTGCENLEEGHGFLQKLRHHMDSKYKNRILLAEANQWPEDAVAYFGEGNECHMAFHFPIMPRLFMSLHMEERFPIIDILNQTPAIPDNCQWAIFLRNHDELTLEMVTDEERDYMYNAYAQESRARINLGIRRRLAPLLGNDRKRLELMNALLFSLPGTPVIYYGDEIGMGDNIYLGDRNGVRTPMQWSPDRNAGFSRANPQKLFLPVITDPEYSYESINVETQQSNPHSLLWWSKRIIALRRRFSAFGRGSVELLHPNNSRILAFLRRYEDEVILVVCNLSRFVQHLSLDLSRFVDYAPVELFGGSEFPAIDERPYFLTLGPHGFYWFQLRPEAVDELADGPDEEETPTLVVQGDWTAIFQGGYREMLEALIPQYLRGQRWFQSKARQIRAVTIRDHIVVSGISAYFALVDLEFTDGGTETYMMPFDLASGQLANDISYQTPGAIIANIIFGAEDQPEQGVIYDPIPTTEFANALVANIQRNVRFRGHRGTVVGTPTDELQPIIAETEADELQPRVLGFEQSNTSIRYGQKLILKLMRKIAPGVNPELEIGRFLANHPTESQIPPLLGSLEYQHNTVPEPVTLGILQVFRPNQGDAWRHTLGWLGRFFDDVLGQASGGDLEKPTIPNLSLVTLMQEETPELAWDMVGEYLHEAQLLGQRTAELHVALASDTEDPAFAPEPFTALYQRSLYQSMRNLTNAIYRLLDNAPTRKNADIRAVRDHKNDLLDAFGQLIKQKLSGSRIRCHGDYHLGQVLYTGDDFVIIDFEGEPGRTLAERRVKHSPLKDVAGMLRSFHYAAYAALPGYGTQSVGRMEDLPVLEPWARFWQVWTSVEYLRAYIEHATPASILPKDMQEIDRLLQVLLLEKAVYELGYELNNRPDWLRVPMQAILQHFGK